MIPSTAPASREQRLYSSSLKVFPYKRECLLGSFGHPNLIAVSESEGVLARVAADEGVMVITCVL